MTVRARPLPVVAGIATMTAPIRNTGANASVVNAADAGRFGLTPALGGLVPAIGIGTGGAQKAGFSTIDSLTIGGVDIRQRRLMTADLSQVVKLLGPLAGGTPIAGIIGQDVMKEHRAVIDVAKPILYLIVADAVDLEVLGEHVLEVWPAKQERAERRRADDAGDGSREKTDDEGDDAPQDAHGRAEDPAQEGQQALDDLARSSRSADQDPGADRRARDRVADLVDRDSRREQM